MAGLAIITEACIDVKDRACVDVCPVQCIYEFDPQKNVLFSEEEAGSGVVENTPHARTPMPIAVFADSILYVNLDECTSCTACYQPDVCPVGAIYSEEHLPDGSPSGPKYNTDRPEQGPRPHLLRPAQPRRVRGLAKSGVRSAPALPVLPRMRCTFEGAHGESFGRVGPAFSLTRKRYSRPW